MFAPPQRRAWGLQGGDAPSEETERKRETEERRRKESGQEEMSCFLFFPNAGWQDGTVYILFHAILKKGQEGLVATWWSTVARPPPRRGRNEKTQSVTTDPKQKLIIITTRNGHKIQNVNKDGLVPLECLLLLSPLIVLLLLYIAVTSRSTIWCYCCFICTLSVVGLCCWCILVWESKP